MLLLILPITRKEPLPYNKYLGCSGHALPCYDLKKEQKNTHLYLHEFGLTGL